MKIFKDKEKLMGFYRNKSEIEFKVGLFTLAALVILISGYMWFTNVLSLKNSQEILVSFEDAAGLERGTSVFIRGINCGKVSQILLRDEDVLISLLVDFDLSLKQGTEFIISDADLMGNKKIDIIQTKIGGPLDLAEIQSGQTAINVAQIIAKAGNMVDDLSTLLTDDNLILLTELQTMISDSKTMVNNVNNLVTSNSRQIYSTINSLSALSKDLEEILVNNKSEINDSGKLIQHIEKTAENLNKTLAKIDQVADVFTTDETTINKLFTEKQLYDNMLKTSQNLDSLIEDIKQNPKRYFKLF